MATLDMRFGVDNAALRIHCREVTTLIDQTIGVVRNIATSLRPSSLDMGIVAALEWLATEFERRTNVECVFLANKSDVVLGETQSVALFRIVQESLTNVVRHAEASRVEVVLMAAEHEVRLSVRDNGHGFDIDSVAQGSFGLLGIRERALMIGGAASIDSVLGEGTSIEVAIPIGIAFG